MERISAIMIFAIRACQLLTRLKTTLWGIDTLLSKPLIGVQVSTLRLARPYQPRLLVSMHRWVFGVC